MGAGARILAMGPGEVIAKRERAVTGCHTLKAAGSTGLPRGLKWIACRITGDAVLVRDTATGGIVALVPVQIDFAPVEGGEMEDVPAAKEPRPATAAFTFHKGAWHTAGRVVFNHTPDQTITAFPELQRVPDHG